jgi:exodeoxyribonuclease V gamma subunit
MIHLVYSNHTEELLAALVDAIRSERAARSPFDPVHLVVPNRNVETYVKHGIAEALGVAANLEITFLQRLAERLARDVAPGARLVDARQIEGHLLALLHDEAFLNTPVLAAVREYLLGAGARPDAIDRRRSGLAAELGRLFDEYGASRPELLQAWRERATLADDPLYGDIEAWQRALWLGIFGPGGRLDVLARAPRVPGSSPELPAPVPLTLAELGRALEAAPGKRGHDGGEAGEPLHVFGVSYIARAYHQVLLALGRSRPVHLYTLNPCREFWEDVESAPELRQRLRRQGRKADFPPRTGRQPELTLGEDPYGLESANENLALRLWGRPGRENIRLLNDRTGGDFVGRFVSNQRPGRKPTLLARLQDDILDRTARPQPDPALTADGSLQVLPCPGVRRELEVIAAEIWRLVDADPSLRLNQIAVVVPESVKDQYLAHVGAVFAEAHQLPHAVVDLPFGGPSRLGEALLMLLELPFGSFTRRELLPLCTHPAVIARFPDARPTEWLHLAEDLGIVHGADHADHAGTYIERDLLNWDQGVRRLALGAFMDPVGATDAGPTPVILQEQAYLPLDRSSDERASALDFSLLVRSLIADARFAAGVTGPRLRPLSQWCDFVRGLCAAYLTPVGSDDEALLGRCLTEIEALESLPLGAVPISFRIAADLIKRALSAQSGGRGQYLAHGVTVTSFVPMRAVPFKVVFVAGLGERAFPSGTRRSELDLRGARRAAGDVTPRQRDLYMFLETLLSARDRLVLSYVARDEMSGSPLSPSSIVRELREIVASGYLGGAQADALFAGAERPPLRRYDDPTRSPLSLLATQEAQAKALGLSLRAALPPGTALPDLGALRRGLPASTFAALGARLSAHEPPDRARRGQGPARLVVPLEALRRFLEDPLQGSARFRLRLREVEGDEELLDREDEPFETDRLQRAMLLRQAMWEQIFSTSDAGTLPTEAQLGESLRRWARVGELRGLGPTGLFGAAEAPAQIAVLAGWLAELRQLASAGGGALGPALLRFGRPSAGPGPSVTELPALTFDIPAPAGVGAEVLPVEIVGRTELQIGAGAGDTAGIHGSLVFAARRDNGPARIFRDRLRAFIDHVALSAAGRGDGSPWATHVVWSYGDRHNTTSARFAPLAAADAQAYLARLIGALVAGASTAGGWASGLHPYLLPCEAVFTAHSNGTAIVDEVEKLRDYYLEMAWKTFSTVNGPVPQAVERHDPPSSEDAERMAQDRFGLYWQLLQEPEGAQAPARKSWGGRE